MSEKVLLVDDEAAVLSGYERTLHREFEVDTAVGGELGLEAIRDRGPYAVVISDMRMPGMNGAQFLSRVRQAAPESTRMLLTGFTDMDAARDAVNEGNIFRFLTKPCAKDVLVPAIHQGVEQYRQLRLEKELLEKTLLGSIKALADVLAAASPEAFSRSMQIVRVVRHVAAKFPSEHPWQLEAAATLSQLGCITLDTNLIQRAFVGMKLEEEEQVRFNGHPQAAMHILAGIPRLEPVAWIIGRQLQHEIPTEIPEFPEPLAKEMSQAANILKLAIAYHDLRVRPLSHEEALGRLYRRRAEFGDPLVDALETLKEQHGQMVARRIPTLRLAPGMVLDQEIRNRQGMLMVAKNQEITRAVLIKLENLARAGLIDKEVMALVPV